MTASVSLRPGTSIADPDSPSHVIKPNSDGSINSSSARDAVAITASDSTVLTNVIGLWVGGVGDVAVTVASGNVTFTAVPAGSLIPIVVTKVLSTGTSASNIVAFKSV